MLWRNDFVNDVWIGAVDYSDSTLAVPEVLLASSLCINDSLDSPLETITVAASQLEVRKPFLHFVSLKTPLLLFLVEGCFETAQEVESLLELNILQTKILNLCLER